MGQFSTLEVKMIAGFGLIWMFTSKLKFRVQFQHLTSAAVTTEGLFWQVLQEFYLADLVQHLSKLTHHTPGYSGWITSGTCFSLRDLFTSFLVSLKVCYCCVCIFVLCMCMRSREHMPMHTWRLTHCFPQLLAAIFSWQGLSLSPELVQSARLADPPATGSVLLTFPALLICEVGTQMSEWQAWNQ